MNVTFEEKDELNALMTIELNPDDYQPRVDTELKNYRKRAKIPGFRPGTAPMGMVKKMVGKSVLADEINRLASDTLFKYLEENKIDVLGQPLSAKDKESEMDFDSPTDFTFYFDLGLAPKFDLALSAEDKLTRYKIKFEQAEVEKEIDNNQRRFGKMIDIEQTESDKDTIKGLLTELDDDNNPLEGGVADKESTVLLEMVKDEKMRDSLKGLKAGDEVIVDIFTFFNDNEKILSTTVGLPAEGLSDLNRNFKLVVTEVKQFVPSELNQELFDQVFGKDAISTEEEFRTKTAENLEAYYSSEAENQLDHTISHLIVNNHQFDLPDDFLKRWLTKSHEETYNTENVDDLYSKESSQLKNQLINEKIIETYKIEVTEEDIAQVSIGYTAQMLRQYGMTNPDFETVRYFEEKNKEDKSYMKRIRDIAIERKVTQQVKTLVTIEDQEITIEEFYKLIESHNQEHNHEHNHG